MTTITVKGSEYQLKQGVTVIGRGKDADIIIEHKGLSRVHARFTCENSEISVEDLDSKNGVFINGKRITEKRVLEKEDNVRIADLECPVEFGETPSESPETPAEPDQKRSRVRRNKSGLGNLVAAAVLVLVLGGVVVYLKNQVPLEQKEAQVFLQEAARDIGAVSVSDNIDANIESLDVLKRYRSGLKNVPAEYSEESEESKRLIRDIDRMTKELQETNRTIAKGGELKDRYSAVSKRIDGGSLTPEESVALLESFITAFPGTEETADAMQRAAKLKELIRATRQSEKSEVREILSTARKDAGDKRFKEAIERLDKGIGKSYRYVDEEKKRELAQLRQTIADEATAVLRKKLSVIRKDAQSGSITDLKEEAENAFIEIGLETLEPELEKVLGYLEKVKQERLEAAKEKVAQELSVIKELLAKRKYTEADALYQKVIPSISEPELKREMENRRLLDGLYIPAVQAIVTYVTKQKGIEVPGLGFIESMSAGQLKVLVDGSEMILSWDKIKDDEFISILQKAIKDNSTVDTCLAYAMVNLKAGRKSAAKQYLAKAAQISDEKGKQYGKLFAEYLGYTDEEQAVPKTRLAKKRKPSREPKAKKERPRRKMQGITVVDKDHLLVHFTDGVVEFVDDGVGKDANQGPANNAENCKMIYFGEKLNLANAGNTANWRIKSSDDDAYRSGLNPSACFRKSKVDGMSQEEWVGRDYRYDYSMEHMIFLKLPQSMKQGKKYTVLIDKNTNTDVTEFSLEYDIFSSRSEAVHTNLVGYMPGAVKAADLYVWMGDGGPRDYSSFAGNDVFIYNVDTGSNQKVGQVSFWQKSAKEREWNFTRSDVWNADFTGFTKPGIYRIAIDGVGCSQDFEIRNDIYKDPFDVSVLGFFYMRIGQDSPNMKPRPRLPLYIPGKSPSNCKVYITTVHPYHPNWKQAGWDNRNWSKFCKPGKPTNPNAWGGHSDALDWDRHLAHVSIIYDMLLPYILTQGAIPDDDTGIAESGNGIPDLLDEAQNEVDLWLRLRDGKGYSHGLNNPTKNNELYQAGCTAMSAWANALNASMMSECYRIAGKKKLMEHYRDAALEAYEVAGSYSDQMLDKTQGLGQGVTRGRDFKMMAAAYLYNVTGDTKFEEVIKQESLAKSPTSEIFIHNKMNQLWGSAAYIFCNRTVHYPDIRNNMIKGIINGAKKKEANYTKTRPTRRGYANDSSTAWFQTIQDMPRTLIAHAAAEDPADKALFLNALVLEAGWGLGRNPLNIVQMTTATTSMQYLRSIENCYTSGRDDGTPGLHPGHTPYLNINDWSSGMVMGRPTVLANKSYPAWRNWPQAEGYFNTRYVYAHSEFTPQQSMRGKMAIYAYLYGIAN